LVAVKFALTEAEVAFAPAVKEVSVPTSPAR
jgi:hypothetical protein